MSNKNDEKLEPPQSEEATPLCPNCLKEVEPKEYYCPHCNSPSAINPNATYMPLQQIRFENEPAARVFPIYGICTLLSFCFVLTWLSPIIVPLCIYWVKKNPRLQTRLNFTVLGTIGVLLICVIIIKIINGTFLSLGGLF